MERIIRYGELPHACGESIYLRMETDPKLYITLMSRGYRIVNNIFDAEDDTIYVTGKRQAIGFSTIQEYIDQVHDNMEKSLKERDIEKPKTRKFSFYDLVNHKYKLPFVLKNETQNGGREKFLIQTEEDYKSLLSTCEILLDPRTLNFINSGSNDDIKHRIDYEKYLVNNFTVQEYIETPTKYNTTVRIITTPSNDTLYSALKYNKPDEYVDDTSMLGFLLSELYPLSTKSIVSNTLSGGENILIGDPTVSKFERDILKKHDIDSDNFQELIKTSQETHKKLKRELGIICGFDYIYDKDKQKWFMLEYHSRPMLGDYSRRQNIDYETEADRVRAEGRVRATALSLVLKKTR